jgi:hypothetical protein
MVRKDGMRALDGAMYAGYLAGSSCGMVVNQGGSLAF